MQYLIDTVTVVRHFSGKGKIGRTATQILDTIEERDDLLVISVVSLMEIMYLAEKHRIDINLSETIERIDTSSKYTVIEIIAKPPVSQMLKVSVYTPSVVESVPIAFVEKRPSSLVAVGYMN